MKKRLYKQNVIDGQIKWDQTAKQIIHDYKKQVFLFIGYFIAAISFSIVVSLLLYEYLNIRITPILFTPAITRYAVVQIKMLHDDRKLVKLLRLNKNVYSEWMKLQMRKKFPDKDRSLACDMFNAYKDSYVEKHAELLGILKEQLKKKPGNALAISVIAGLIFLSNDKNDYDILFNARYKHGAAGNIIPPVWIRLLSPDENFSEKTHSECAEEFLSYWGSV